MSAADELRRKEMTELPAFTLLRSRSGQSLTPYNEYKSYAYKRVSFLATLENCRKNRGV